MSYTPHRINNIEYASNNNLHFLKQNSHIYNHLSIHAILYDDDIWNPTHVSLWVKKLEEFVNDYIKDNTAYEKELIEEIEKDDMIESFKQEIAWAKANNKEDLEYHYF